MRDALARLELTSFVKTTGGKGLHVVVPLAARQGWSEVKAFSHAVARTFAAQEPQRYVATMAKKQRGGKIFIDYLRNAAGATAILPYSPRARPGATVAMPVDWRDLRHVDPQEFTVASVPGLLRRRRSDPWAELPGLRQELPELKELR